MCVCVCVRRYILVHVCTTAYMDVYVNVNTSTLACTYEIREGGEKGKRDLPHHLPGGIIKHGTLVFSHGGSVYRRPSLVESVPGSIHTLGTLQNPTGYARGHRPPPVPQRVPRLCVCVCLCVYVCARACIFRCTWITRSVFAGTHSARAHTHTHTHTRTHVTVLLTSRSFQLVLYCLKTIEK